MIDAVFFLPFSLIEQSLTFLEFYFICRSLDSGRKLTFKQKKYIYNFFEGFSRLANEFGYDLFLLQQ